MSETINKGMEEEHGPVITHHRFDAITHEALGKEIRLSPRTHCSINQPAGFINFPKTKSVFLHFGIGKDHVGYVVMTEEALRALQAGEKIDASTLADYRQQVLGSRRAPARKKKGGKK